MSSLVYIYIWNLAEDFSKWITPIVFLSTIEYLLHIIY